MKFRNTILLAFVSLFAFACEEDNFIDTGTANGKYNGTMLQYLRSDRYNWDSTVVLIERAGLTGLFNGEVPENRYITFFGPTSHSIRAYLLDNPDGYKKIQDIPVSVARDMVLQYVVGRKVMKDEFDFDVPGTNTGGTEITTLGGSKLRVYRHKTAWAGVPDAGPVSLNVESYKAFAILSIASANIEPANGVVHSLPYTFKFGSF